MVSIVVEASNGFCSIACLENNKVLSQRNMECSNNLSTIILQEIDNCLNDAGKSKKDLTEIIASNGPGSYTAIRVVASICKTLAYTLKLPLKVVSSLKLQALLEFESNKSAILGSKIAEKLNLKVGDLCRIVTLNKNEKGKTVPKITSFKISAIISSGYQELDALWVFIPLEEGLKIMDQNSSLTSIVISTKNPFDDLKMSEFQELLSSFLPESFSVYTWFDLNRPSFTSFKTTKNILMFIMFLIVLVASANISSAIVMLVMERRREIAILKAAGAHPVSISMDFLLAGLLTSLGGVILGMPLGVLTAVHINTIFAFTEKLLNYFQNFFYKVFYNGQNPLEIHILDPAYYLEYIPIKLNFYDLYIIAVSMLILSVVVCLIPAVRAGREKPIEIMRKL